MSLIFKRTRDIDSIMEIVEDWGIFFDEDSYDEIEEDTESDEVFGAFDSETKKMLGFIILCELNPEVIEITWMAVSKKSKGQGIGQQLLTFALNTLCEKNSYKMAMAKTIGEGDTQKSFANTRRFYLKYGFVALDSIRPYPGWHKSKYVQTFVKCLQH